MEIVTEFRWAIAFGMVALIAFIVGHVATIYASPYPRILNWADYLAAVCGLLWVGSTIMLALSVIWALFS